MVEGVPAAGHGGGRCTCGAAGKRGGEGSTSTWNMHTPNGMWVLRDTNKAEGKIDVFRTGRIV